MRNRTEGTLRVYEQQADVYWAQWGRRRYRVPPLLRELIKTIPKTHSDRPRILDLGCGPGQDTRYLRSRGYASVGLDAVGSFVSRAREKPPLTPFVRADLRRLPFGSEGFEAIWSAASLIHLSKSEISRVLASLLRIVRPGGRLAATLAHGMVSGVVSHGWLPGRYISRWTKAELAEAVTRAGWTIDGLITISNRERKGRWLNLLATRPDRPIRMRRQAETPRVSTMGRRSARARSKAYNSRC